MLAFMYRSPKARFAVVNFLLGELGDGLIIYQGIYLVGIGWNEGAVGLALSLMGLTSLLVQPFAGDWIDKTTYDRRLLLYFAGLVTALSAASVMFVREGNTDHMMIFLMKFVEGIATSFIRPCISALTLATFGPRHYDAVMASNLMWAHVGSVVAAIITGCVSYQLYPNVKYFFIVLSGSALLASLFSKFLPLGDSMMARGFLGKVSLDERGHIEKLESDSEDSTDAFEVESVLPVATSYLHVFFDRKSVLLCLIGFFFHLANANVLLVLGELMGGDEPSGELTQSSIPLVAGAIVLAQLMMAIATWAGDFVTSRGCGRRPLLLAGLLSQPIRCALIILWKDTGDSYLLSTQIFDGLGSGLVALMHPYLVADISFGTGRFNVLMGLSSSMFGLGSTLSNFLGQIAVEKFSHTTSLAGSFIISLIPIVLYLFLPETYGARSQHHHHIHDEAGKGLSASVYTSMT